MSALFELTVQAIEDLDSIWWFIVEDSWEAADRVETDIVATCRRLAGHPLIGHRRRDITPLPVRFWMLPKYPNYTIVYRAEIKPLQVVAILHGKQDMGEVLKDRLPE
jgi:plasmid stabilization system protein ParE